MENKSNQHRVSSLEELFMDIHRMTTLTSLHRGCPVGYVFTSYIPCKKNNLSATLSGVKRKNVSNGKVFNEMTPR